MSYHQLASWAAAHLGTALTCHVVASNYAVVAGEAGIFLAMQQSCCARVLCTCALCISDVHAQSACGMCMPAVHVRCACRMCMCDVPM